MEPTKREMLESMNNGFGPISKRRGRKAVYLSWMVLLAFLAISGICLYKSDEKRRHLKSWYFELTSLLAMVLIGILGEFIRRCCLFFEEYSHIEKRYLGKTWDAILACFYQKNITLVAVVSTVCFVFAVVLSSDEQVVFDTRHLEIFLLGLVVLPLVSYLLDLRTPTVAERSQMSEAESSNVADGLAWSYYLGYLKLILPHLDETINKTDVKIGDSSFRDKVAACKLFIVLPKDCYCYTSFDEVDPRITYVNNTQPLHISRAGVSARVYKNTIYKISVEDMEFHCLMEYATPLQSMFDMYSMLKDDRSPLMEKKEIDQQVVQFVKKLKEILEKDKECRGKYRLVTVADVHDDLADVMVREIMDARIDL